MLAEMKRLLVGKPLSNEQLAHERLPKRTALAVFSSDALSSVAYATEAILIALMFANRQALGLATNMPLATTITAPKATAWSGICPNTNHPPKVIYKICWYKNGPKNAADA